MKNNQPLVTVVMSCYNHRKYVGEAIESVLSQTYTNFEFLIADDASSDGSAEIIKEYKDERITFFEYTKNTGFRAWEDMERRAKGKYITYIASDDAWREDKLEKQVAFLEEHADYEACFTWVETIDGESNIAGEENSKNEVFNTEEMSRAKLYSKLFLEGNRLAAPSYMMKNEVFQALGGFRFKYRQLQDYDLWMRYMLNHNLYIIPEKLTYYRWHENDGTSNISAGSSDTTARIWNEGMHIYKRQMELISDEFFVEAFEDKLVRKGNLTKAEVMCEKFLLMLNHPKPEAQQSAIDYYFDHIDEPEFFRCMEDVYDFSRSDFYTMEVNRGMMKAMSEFQLLAKDSEKLANTALRYAELLKVQLENR